ncbi:MAG: hypothetical protein ACLUE1_05450 [Adlercreutzia equolifaciens]
MAGLGRTGFGILVVFSIVSIAGMMSAERVEGIPLQAILLFSALMMAVVAAMAISGPRRISLFFLYRWICPTLVIGFAAVILFGQAGALVAVAASLGGRFTFCLIAQIYFANTLPPACDPAQASSLGWLFVHAGPSGPRFVDRFQTADVGTAGGAHRGERGVHRRSRDGLWPSWARLHIPAHSRAQGSDPGEGEHRPAIR